MERLKKKAPLCESDSCFW